MAWRRVEFCQGKLEETLENTKCTCACQVTSVPSDSSCPYGLQAARSSVHGILQARILLGCHGLLQGILPTQGLNPPSLMSPALAGKFFPTSATWEAQKILNEGNQRVSLGSPMWAFPGDNKIHFTRTLPQRKYHPKIPNLILVLEINKILRPTLVTE